MHRLNLAFLVLDAIGLVVFTMAGCDVAWQMNASLPIVIVAGMITGCAGGVLRDILCNDVPLLFRSELYASVSVVTGLFYATAFGLKLNDEVWTALTFALGLTLAPARDPLQMGNAEIRLRRGRAAMKRAAYFARALSRPRAARHRRRGIAPGIADVSRDIGDLLVRHFRA